MVSILIFTLLVFLWFVYSGLLVYFYKSWQKAVSSEHFEIAPKEKTDHLKLSVVVALRNEALNLPSLLQSFEEQLIDKNLFELILIDDFSSDNSQDIIHILIKQYPNIDIRLLSLSEHLEFGTGKKAAVSLGISQAKYPVISLTDADCTPPQQWLAKVRHKMSSGKMKVLCGPVLIGKNPKTNIESLQQFDFSITQLINSGAAFRQLFHLGNAANLSFYKSIFQEVNGYSNDQYASGDDVLLLQKISELDKNAIYFSPEKSFAVYTKAEKSKSDFYKQRLRWASKNKSYNNPYLQLTQISVLLVNVFTLILLISLPISLFFGKITMIIPILLIVKFSLDYFVANQAFSFYYKKSSSIFAFFNNWLNHSIYISYVGLKSLITKTYEWKGRRLS